MWLIYDHPEEPARITAFQLHSDEESAICLATQFFDDEELVLLLEETKSGQRYLVTVRYADMIDDTCGRNFPLFLSLDADRWPLRILRLSPLL